MSKRTKAEEAHRQDSIAAWRFYYKHAGWSYPAGAGPIAQHRERVCCALQLSRAMHWYRDQDDLFFEWEEDSTPYDPGDAKNDDGTPYTPNEVLCLVLYRNVVTSDGYKKRVVVDCLGGIADPDYAYKRVCEAEMALGCMNAG